MKQRMPILKGWTNAKAMVADSSVLQIGKSLIRGLGKKVVFDRVNGGDFKGEVSTAKVEAVFRWIVNQTKGFRVPVMINFQRGEAPIIGLTFCRIGTELSNKLYALDQQLHCIPWIAVGWHSGPSSPYMMISDMFRIRGKQGYSLEGVQVINIIGESKPIGPEPITVSLKDIK